MKKRSSLFIILLIISFAETICGQGKSDLEIQADKLHKSYRFDEAIGLYNRILEQSPDSLYKIDIEKKIILSENGKTLLEFGFTPELVAVSKFNVADFFLHYPGFPDKSWVPLPQELTGKHSEAENTGFIPAVYFPEDANKLIYSAPDNSGSWNIYTTHKINDTLWSAPVTLNENITSVGNELFPYLAPDGKTLYFSSNGHYGMGGYDLYVSYWDEETKDWGVAQNMGFPFSSVGNDFFFYNTPDGLYSVFASDRENGGEQMTVYAVKFENLPLKKNILPDDALKIALLKPEEKKPEEASIVENGGGEQDSEYNLAVKSVRKLQQEIKSAIKQQQQNRELYNTLTNEDDLKLLEKKIAEQETKMLALQQELNLATAHLQKVEMDFLSKGIIISEKDDNTDDNGAEQETSGNFSFADNTFGTVPVLNIEITEPEIDLSFKILDKAVIADIADMPDGLVYQIQLFVVSSKPTVKALKGLSPVFERKGPTGKYIYSAGTFRTYEEALKNINKVKKRGFPTAMITAYNKGKSLSIKNARTLEQKEKDSAVYQIIISGFEILPAEYVKTIRDNTEKDIAKTVENGSVRYVIGPFSAKAEAEELKESLDKAGLTGILLEKIEKTQ